MRRARAALAASAALVVGCNVISGISSLGFDRVCDSAVTPSTEICGTPADENCDGIPDCTGATRWGWQLGYEGSAAGRAVAFDARGDLFVAGTFNGSILLGGNVLSEESNNSLFVAKFDSAGMLLWGRSFAKGSTEQIVTSIAVDAGGDLVVAGMFGGGSIDFGGQASVQTMNKCALVNGTYDCQGFVAKLRGADGGGVWATEMTAANGVAPNGVAIDPQGEVVLTGYYDGLLSLGAASINSAGGHDIFAAKLAPNGDVLWVKSFGALGEQLGAAAATDATGNVFIAGDFEGTLKIAGVALVSQGSGMVKGKDAFVAMLDPNGNAVSAKSFGGPSDDLVTGIAVDGAGDVALSGIFRQELDAQHVSRGGFDIFLVKLHSDLSVVKLATFGSTDDDMATGVAIDGAGNVVIAGYETGAVDFGGKAHPGPDTDAFVAKFVGNLDYEYDLRYPSGGGQHVFAVAVDSLGDIGITGDSTGSIQLGSKTIAPELPDAGSSNGAEALVAELYP